MSAVRKDEFPDAREPNVQEQAALEWFARRERGLSRDQQLEFENWLAADARHAALFAEYDGTWSLLARAAERRMVGALAPAGGSGELPHKRPWRGLRTASVALAITAALVVAYAGWWRPIHYSAATVTDVGVLRTLKLPDGSVVTLNTDSAVTVAFTPAERRVRLARGEGHFAVKKNAARPFVVEANGVAVRAVGTAFNVRLRSAAVEVLVTEGKVRVDDMLRGESLLPAIERTDPGVNPVTEKGATAGSAGPAVLSAGERIIVAVRSGARADVISARSSSRVVPVASEEMQRELAWQGRRLEFVAAPLADMVAEFNRYNRHQLLISDPRLAARRFGGSFRPHDHAGFVRVLHENFGVVAESVANQTTLRLAE